MIILDNDNDNLTRLEWRVWSPPEFPIMNQSILYRRTGKVIHYHPIFINIINNILKS